MGQLLKGDESKVRCPLCLKKMIRLWDPIRKIFILACRRCKVAIAELDPHVGLWDKAYEKEDPIYCPMDGEKMRFFCTSTGFIAAECPKCGADVREARPDREGKKPSSPDVFPS